MESECVIDIISLMISLISVIIYEEKEGTMVKFFKKRLISTINTFFLGARRGIE